MAEKDTTDAETKGGTESKAQPTQGSFSARIMQAIVPSAVPTSKTSPQNPEPVILEEHVVEKTSKETIAEDVGLKLPTPPPQTSASLKPKPLVMPLAPAMSVQDDLTKVPEHVLPSPIAFTPAQAAAPQSIKPTPTVPTTPASTPTPPVPPPVVKIPQPQIAVEPPAETPTEGNMGNDIQRILSQVKLPERREFKAAADAKPIPENQPKNLAQMVTKPPLNEQEARVMAAKPDANTISSVHTLKDDLQHAVKEKKMSLVRVVALEQDKKRDEMVEEEFGRKERRKRVTGILFATFLLFGLGFAALFGVYVVMMSHSATSVESLNSIVFAEQSVALPLDNATPSELKRRVAAARQSQMGSLGSITRIVPLFQSGDPNVQPTQATTAQFFKALGFNAPDDLVHALGDTFFFGLHVVDKNAPVLVIPVTNYDRAFAGMLAWEATMNPDLSPAFTPVPTTILDSNGIPSARVFQDDVMRNYDVRELKDDSGAVELYYSFPSKNLLIIAESPYSFPELLSRLQSVRRL